MTGGTDPAALRDLALDVARSAVELVRDHRTRGVEVAATKSSDVDVVTAADRASEELVRSMLRERRPDDAVLGEEGEDEPGTTGLRWVVDPIDGTVNFLYGLPQYAVSVAVQRASGSSATGWETVAGAVVNAATGTEYAAHAGPDGPVGTRDGAPVRVRDPQPLAQMLLATGFSYDRDVRARQARSLVALLPRVRDVRRMGSCALDLCHVAEGTLDGYVEEGVHLWDHAAAVLVAQAAGARAELLPGASGRDLLVCGPEGAFEELRAAVVDAGYAAPGAGPDAAADPAPRGE